MLFPSVSVVLICIPSLVIGLQYGGSCREAKLCCNGRDASCVVSMANGKSFLASNDIAEDFDERDRTCFCDSACRDVGDCCDDYESTCEATDCQVSEWGSWSECNVKCGQGSMTRERRVTRESRNGGKSCPELIQRRGCNGDNCEVTRSSMKASREAALILPSSYSNVRSINETVDRIRENLIQAYPKNYQKENSSPYCILFEVSKSRKGCETSEQIRNHLLTTSKQVCVSCATAAMRKHLGYRCHGHGVDDHHTKFSVVSTGNCHGRWVRKGSFSECPCHPDGRPDFIFI